MTTADIINGIITSKDDIKTSLQNKGQSVGSSDTLRSLARKLNLLPYSNRKGGSIHVIVIDYDGTLLLDEYRVPGETIRLSPAKAMTCHDRLVFDYWVSNVPITDGATSDDVSTLTVPDDNDVLIGPIYHTKSGKTEFDVEVSANGTVTIKGSGTFDWGDGTTNSTNSHTYSSTGKYTILFDGTFNGTPYINDVCTEIRFSNNITEIINSYLSDNSLLKSISLPPGLLSPSSSTDLRDASSNKLRCLIYPKYVTMLGSSAFKDIGNNDNSILEKYVLLPHGLTDIDNSAGASISGKLYCPLPSTITERKYENSERKFMNTVLVSRVKIPPASFSTDKCFLENYSFNKLSVPYIKITSNVPRVEEYCFYNATVQVYDLTDYQYVPELGENVFPASGEYVIRVNSDLYEQWQTALQGYYAQTRIQPIHIERGLYEKCLSLISDRDSITGALSPMTYDDLDDTMLSECSDVLDGIGYRNISTLYMNSPRSIMGSGVDARGTISGYVSTDLVSILNSSLDWEIYLVPVFPANVSKMLLRNDEQGVNGFYYSDAGYAAPNRHRFAASDIYGNFLCNYDINTPEQLIFPYAGNTAYECRIVFRNGHLRLFRRVENESNWLCLADLRSANPIRFGNTSTPSFRWGQDSDSQTFYLYRSYIKADGRLLWSAPISQYGKGWCYLVNDTSLSYNVVRTGGTLSNGLFTGASGAYLTLPYIQTYDYDSWWFEFSYRYADNGNTFNCIVGQYDTNNSGYTLNVMDGQLAINALDRSGSWIFADSQTGLYPVEGTEYHIRCGYGNGAYFLDYRLNASGPYTRQWSYSSNTHNYQNDSNICLMGSRLYDTSRFNPGTMDLNTFKFYGNGQLLIYGGNMALM